MSVERRRGVAIKLLGPTASLWLGFLLPGSGGQALYLKNLQDRGAVYGQM